MQRPAANSTANEIGIAQIRERPVGCCPEDGGVRPVECDTLVTLTDLVRARNSGAGSDGSPIAAGCTAGQGPSED